MLAGPPAVTRTAGFTQGNRPGATDLPFCSARRNDATRLAAHYNTTMISGDDPEAFRPFEHCRRCGVAVQPGRGDGYLVRIQALADPAPPVFTADDLARDPREEIARLVEALKDLSPQQALDQVYRQMVFWLCGRCYRDWIEHPV